MTLDSNKAPNSVGKIRKWECVCARTSTHTHRHTACKKTPPTSCTASTAETETTQVAVPSLVCLCCVFTTQRQMVSWHCSTLMSLGGSAGSTFISTVLFEFTATFQCTCMHTKRQRGMKKKHKNKTLWLPNGIFHPIMTHGRLQSFQAVCPNVCRELKKSSQFGTSEAKWRMTGRRLLCCVQKCVKMEISMFLKRARI